MMILQTDLFGNRIEVPVTPKKGKRKIKAKPKTNPLINYFGAGPAGVRCKSCVHQYFKRFANTYSKCNIRGDSGGASTDHNSNYFACGKYEPKPDDKKQVKRYA